MTIITKTPEETKKVAHDIIKTLKGGEVLLLYGDLGSGKTTFTQGLAEALGIKQRVNSPTFLISKSYTTNSDHIRILNHLDLYRVQHEIDLRNLGIAELFKDKNALNVVEWPEKIESLLLDTKILIKFEYVDEETRKIILENYE